MPNTSRTRLTAILASLVVLFGALVSTTGAQATAQERQKTPYSRAQAEKLLAQVQQALAPAAGSARRKPGSTPRRDLGLLMRQLKKARPALARADRAAADIATERPIPDSATCAADTQPGLPPTQWAVKVSTHFCLHYQTSGAAATTSTWASKTIAVLEHVYYYETSHLKFRAPLKDQDGKYDVFLDDIGQQGYYGFCTTDDLSATSTAWCELDNDFAKSQFNAWPTNSLSVTAAHEFFHAIQFAYDADDSTWFLEGTAVWMEDQVYPKINDYLQYLTYSQITQSEVPIDTTGTFERYGAVIFWKYLSEGYHSVDIIRRIWDAAAVSRGTKNGIQAAQAVLRLKHVGWAGAFARFSVWNTLPTGSYGDRRLFPHPVYWKSGGLGTSVRDTGVQSISLDHLSSANATLIPSAALPTRSRLRITVEAPSIYVGQARIQVRKTDGSTTYESVSLNSSGDGSRTVYFSGKNISSVRLTLANVAFTANKQKFTFRATVTLP
ncbi:MAG: MXAN_6640 family putative metalloprotease [Marmoricola sp.]